MPLIEALTLQVGPAIAKAMFRYCEINFPCDDDKVPR